MSRSPDDHQHGEASRRREHEQGPSSRRRGDDQGFSLLEVVIAIFLLLLVLVPVSYILANTITQSANAREKTTALGIAEQWVETLNNQGPPANAQGLPNVGNAISEGTQTASNVPYKVSAVFNWATVNGVLDLCTSGTVPQVLGLQVTVTWGPSNSVTDTTLIDYPPASVPTNGFIAVQLYGDPSGVGNPEPADVSGVSWGGPSGRVTKVPVTATLAGTTYTTHPDTNGCAFMEVPPSPSGTPYTVQVGPETLTTAFAVQGSLANDVTSSAAVATDSVTALGPFLYDEGASVNVGYPSTTSTDNGVTCPDAGQIQCVVTGQSPSSASTPNTGAVTTASILSGSTWSSTTLPGSVSQIESTSCASSACIGVGFGPAGGGYQGVAVVDSTSAPGTWSVSTLPAGVTNLTEITCPSSTICMAIGSGASGAVLLTAAIAGTSVTWSPDTLPAGVASLSQITCSGTTACVAIGSTSSGAAVVAGTVSAGAQTFVADTLPGNPAYLSGIGCFTTGGTTSCEAPGAAQTGALLLSDASVTSGVDSWTSGSTSGLSGMYMADLPISVNSTDLASSFVACSAGSCGTSVGPLFPFAAGYSVGAGDCAAEVATASSLASTVPGASGSSAADVTLSLGLLPVEVTAANGAPQAGATVTATVADPNLPADAACNDGVAHALPPTGPDGLSRLAALYETYTITASFGGTTVSATVQVTPTASIVNPTSATPVVIPLPQPVVINL